MSVVTKMKMYICKCLIFLVFIKKNLCELYEVSDETIQQADILQTIPKKSEISCLLLCKRNNHCSRIGYQRSTDSSDGICLLLAKKESKKISESEVNDSDVKVYDKVLFYWISAKQRSP